VRPHYQRCGIYCSHEGQTTVSLLRQHSRRLSELARTTIAVLALVSAGVFVAAPASGKPNELTLPSPLRFVSNLDLECFKTDPYQPPYVSVLTRHINPVLTDLPEEQVVLGSREQLCVPVAKNGVIPPPEVLEFIRFVDLSCYRIEGITVDRQLRLTQLNPQLSDVPDKTVVITRPQQLCVPVVKNGVYPPPEVLELVRYIDLKCYLAEPQYSMDRTLLLTHLNQVLYNLPDHYAGVTYNKQLCVPVQKNNQPMPPYIYNIVQYIDLEKYDIETPVLPTPYNLQIDHINPDLTWLPTEPVTLYHGEQLALPVAKNGLIPPDF